MIMPLLMSAVVAIVKIKIKVAHPNVLNICTLTYSSPERAGKDKI
jgi:hypothetical protein